MDQVAHGETSKDDRHHMRRHEAEGVDSEDKANLHVASDNASKSKGDHSPKSPFMHGKQASHNEDVGSSSDKHGELTNHTHPHDDAGLHEKLASHGLHIHDGGHSDITSDSLKSEFAHGKHTSHESGIGVRNELSANTQVHETHIHDNGGTEFMRELGEKPATCDKHLPDAGHAGNGLGDNAHGKHIHVQDVQVLSETGEQLMVRGKQHANTDARPSSAEAKHRLDAEEENMSNTLEEKSPRHEKIVHEGETAGVNHDNRHKQEKRRDDAQETVVLQERGEKCQSVDDDCEYKRAFSDGNSPREKVHFSRGSTPDVDTPTQHARHPKISKAGGKGVGSTERGPGSTDGNPETPSTSWAFSARASLAPSKFDHMATLRMTYGAYKESSQGKEGVPLSLLPEILESARFMVPPPRDLVPLLQRIDPEYKSGDLVRWSLLQSLALQIERKEARYPSVFIPRCSIARPSSSSPNSWKAVQRSPSRRTHPEDDCPELEPQVYEMMKEIDNHRRKSAKEGNYLAADAAAQRLLELKLFEDNKRRATMLERHAQEREQAEKAYKEELQERNQLWDERLKNFQKEVVDHAQRLKQQHIAALQHFKEKMASKTPVKAQWSRELLKQRRIQIYLGKQGKYLEAQEVKQSADRMEQAELQAAIAAFQAEVIGKEQTVRVKQQTEMDILLQRAARTREEIRKSRTLDLQRCHQRHKNVMRELAAIQKQEVFRFDQLMQKKVQNPYTGVGFGGQRVSQSPSSRSHANALDYSTDDALYSGGEDSSMKD